VILFRGWATPSMAKHNRREFLNQAGSALAGAAVFPVLRSSIGLPGTAVCLPAADPDLKPAAGPEPLPGPKKIRGVMIDAARVPETLDYYHRVIAFCAEWQLNTVHFRLADDQGTALRFTSVPGLFTHDHAFTADQVNELIRFASNHGVDVIPEIESFGHSGFITRSATYAHLLDAAPDGSSDFTGVIPVHPETLQLFTKLYHEIANIFPSPYLHGGCDEVNWGGSGLSQRALRSKSRPQIWAEYLNALSRIAESLGKQFIVWGDFVLHKEPEILTGLNKSIIIMDWDYRGTSAGRFHDSLEKVKTHGARAIGAPGLISYRWGTRAGTDQLLNIDAFADAYLEPGDPGSLGVILTNWVPSRYVQSSIWDGFAYAAVAFNDGTAVARKSAFRRFVERHYRTEWNEDWSKAFRLIYDSAPVFVENAPLTGLGLHLPVPWSSDAELQASLKKHTPDSDPFSTLHGLLASLGSSVRAHHSDFQAFALSVEYLEVLFWRESVIQEQARKNPVDRAAATALILEIQERDHKLAAALSKDWDDGRFPDSLAKTKPLFGMQPKDQLVFQFKRAEAYSTSLSLHPDHFFQLLESSGLGSIPSISQPTG
jgi:Glycosyl hydrolase family 20, catalytic domain